MQIMPRYEKESARDYALRIIKNGIITLELEPGSMVSESELAAEMGLSRTPVREALIELSKTGIVEIYPQKGTHVSKIDYNLVEEARFMRLVLEKAVVELACEMASEQDILALEENLNLQDFYIANAVPDKIMELDNAFHQMLFRICNKMQTYQLMDSMTAHFDRVRRVSLNVLKDIVFVQDHYAIVDAIRNRDKDAAGQAMVNHLSLYKIDEEVIRQKYAHYVVQREQTVSESCL